MERGPIYLGAIPPEDFAFVMREEGGYTNDPDDPGNVGGGTKWGITQARYTAFRAARKLPNAPVRHATLEERDAFYREVWAACGAAACVELGRPRLAGFLFDWGTNAGEGRARRWLQRALGVTVDGIYGPRTIGALAACDETAVVSTLIRWRVWFHLARCGDAGALARLEREAVPIRPKPNPSQRKFLPTWLGRTRRLATRLGLAELPALSPPHDIDGGDV